MCIEIVTTYAAVQARKEGRKKPLGTTTLRSRIMADYGTDYDSTLTSYDIRDWIKGSSLPGDEKFRYIDDFVRKIDLNSPDYGETRSNLIYQRDIENRKSLKRLYCSSSVDENIYVQNCLNELSGETFVSPIISNNYGISPLSPTDSRAIKQIVIRFHNNTEGVLGVKCLYLEESLNEIKSLLNISRRNSTPYFGYLLPAMLEESWRILHGTVLLYLPWAQGIDALNSSLSTQLYGRSEDIAASNFHIQTNWSPQIAVPKILHNLEAKKQISAFPNLDIRNLEDETLDLLYSEGVMYFYKLENKYKFIDDYINSLTNGYFSW